MVALLHVLVKDAGRSRHDGVGVMNGIVFFPHEGLRQVGHIQPWPELAIWRPPDGAHEDVCGLSASLASLPALAQVL